MPVLRWLRKRAPAEEHPVAFADAAENLIGGLGERLSPSGLAEPVRRLVQRFLGLPPEAQERELPATYVVLEQYLVEVDQEAGLTRDILRSEVVEGHPKLLEQPEFRLIFEPAPRQQVLLSRALLRTIVERANETASLLAEPLAEVEAWLEEIPGRPSQPPPLGIDGGPPGDPERWTPSDWTGILSRLSGELYARLVADRGEDAAHVLFEAAYEDVAAVYIGLPPFSSVVRLLPEPLLDEAKVRLLNRSQMQRILLEKADKLEARNRQLSRSNRELQETRRALEQANDALEDRVAERTAELHETNERLRASEERLRLVSSAAHDAILMVDDEARLTFWNPAAERVFGFAADEILGRQVFRHLVPRSRQAEFRMAFRTFRRGGSAPGVGRISEQPARRHDGGALVVELSLAAVRVGRRWHAVGVVRDITARKQAELEERQLQERIQEAQRLESLGVLAGGIAHDFNNLLSTILGNASLASRQVGSGSPAVAGLANIETAAERAAELTQQMLVYSGRGQLVVQPLDLTALVREMAQLLEVSISKRAEVVTDFAVDLPAIEADRSQVQQVVMNLITNASDALIDGQGTIFVRTGRMHADEEYFDGCAVGGDAAPGEYVFFEVSDDGSGMDEETQRRVFEPFFSTKFTGRGLGMAAVLGILRGHGAAARLSSRPGAGTVFRILFPASSATVSAPPPAVSEATLSWRGEGTALVVDDEPPVRAVVSRMLEELGFSVLRAADGEEALRVYEEHREAIVLVLMDMTMPSMDGIEACRRLHEVDSTVRVLLCSGYSQQEVAVRSGSECCAGFLQKPYRLEDLLLEVRGILDPGVAVS